MLRGSLYYIVELYLTMQLLVYVLSFNLKIPALTEIILIEFKNLIEFNALNIETIVLMFNPEFSLTQWLRGAEQPIVNEDQKVSVMADINVYLSIAVLIFLILEMILLASLILSRSLRAKIKSLIT